MMRKTLDRHEDISERTVEVIRLVEDLGLEPPSLVKPLPEIDKQDVNLVTWLALVPREVRFDLPSSLHAIGQH